jgi:hypothetical protein
MGIRFICQNCQERLNVKSTQAGQKGECPYCKNIITVPTDSSKSSADLANEENVTVDSPLDIDSQILDAGLSGSIALESAEGLEAFSIPFTPQKVGAKDAGKDRVKAADSFLLDKPEPPTTLGKIDPIAEAPRKVWYFRSKALGEKGPLKGREMQAHLDKGDVKIGCIVWREDWEDWQPAERVFPPLVALAEQIEIDRMTRTGDKIPDELNPHSVLQRRRRQMRMIGIVAIAAGLLTIGALAFVLIRLISG